MQENNEASSRALVYQRIPSSAAWKPLFVWSFMIPGPSPQFSCNKLGNQKAWGPRLYPQHQPICSHCMTPAPGGLQLPLSSGLRTPTTSAHQRQGSRTSTCQLLFIAIPVTEGRDHCTYTQLQCYARLLDVICHVKALSVTVLLEGFSTAEQKLLQIFRSPTWSSTASGSLLTCIDPCITDQDSTETNDWSSSSTDKSDHDGGSTSEARHLCGQATPSVPGQNLSTQSPAPLLTLQDPTHTTLSWPGSHITVNPWMHEEPHTVINQYLGTSPTFDGNRQNSCSSTAQTDLSLPDDDNFHYPLLAPTEVFTTTALIVCDALDPGATSDACSSKSSRPDSSRANSPASSESQSELPETFLLLPLAVTSALNVAFPPHHEPSHPSHTLTTCTSLPRNRPPYLRCSLEIVPPITSSSPTALGPPKRSLDIQKIAAPATQVISAFTGSFTKRFLDIPEISAPATPVTPVSMNSFPSCDSTSHLGDADCDAYTYAASSHRSTASEFGHHHRTSSGCSRSFACEFGLFDMPTLPPTVPAHSAGCQCEDHVDTVPCPEVSLSGSIQTEGAGKCSSGKEVCSAGAGRLVGTKKDTTSPQNVRSSMLQRQQQKAAAKVGLKKAWC